MYTMYVTSLINISTYSGTGKSHFRALISGKERPSCRQSTALATEADQIVPAACMTHDFEEEMVEFHRYKYGSKVKWLVVKNKKLSQLIAKTIHNQTKGRQSFSDSCINLIPYSLVNKRMRLSLSLARKYAPIR